MAITASDIKFYLSGGAANSDPNASLGGAISSTEIVSASLHNLFDKVTGDESYAGDTEYRCFYVKNTHGSLTWESVFAWISSAAVGGDAITIAKEASSGSPVQTIVSESVAPVGPVFSTAVSKAAGLSLGDMAAGVSYAIWVKRVVSALTSAYNTDTATIKCEGDTAQ
jgi:hypothetical protein